MVAFEIDSPAYAKIILHAAKYSVTSIAGALIGSKVGTDKIVVSDAVPLFHNVSPLTPMTEVALQQVEIYAEQTGKKVVGIYYGNEVALDKRIPAFLAMIVTRIEGKLGGSAGLLMLEDTKLNTKELALTAYQYGGNNWKTTTLTSKDINIPTKTAKLITDREFEKLVDFDNHLDNIRLDWLRNEAVSSAIRV
ncbi:ER membrane protein complex subunit 8 [Chytridiales sp. JEL 0842]|nr:ER membrane protein complex subunit 8 [Chytridiales sp. JEL 0842]